MDDKPTNPELPEPKDNGADVDGDHNDLTAELVAYLDGELDRHENEAVGTKISLDANVRAEADALKKTWDLLDHLPRPAPSANFTERTVSRIEPIRLSGLTNKTGGLTPGMNGEATAASQAATVAAPAPSPSKQPLGERVVAGITWLAVLSIVGFAGYFIRGQVVDRLNLMEQQENDARILSENRLLQNLRNYRHIDDIEFLEALDNPELFGEEQSVPMNEGSR